MSFQPIQALHQPYAHLYVGDYFADTLDLSAHEHRALRLLLLETWVHGPIGNVRLPRVAGLTTEEWRAVKPAVLPLLRRVQPMVAESIKRIRTFDGQRLPAEDWRIVRSIVLERDAHACTYCGSDKQLEGDHIVPLSRGGSNAFVNLATACRPCNLSKGSRTLDEWRASLCVVVTLEPDDARRSHLRAGSRAADAASPSPWMQGKISWLL
jgi:hypothetical protein